MYFLIVLTTDYCWRSWTSRIAAPYKSRVDWLIETEAVKVSYYLDSFKQTVARKLIAYVNAKVDVVGIANQSVDEL